ncbi:DUF1643 domain-containing protein [Bacillus sp. (in: firmicutes)]|uniref:DUF1643 domain-containing protein n=1 Tax=Bacillus sp. TaxID=1409 RepID=UPI0023F2138C|nr:DUF1643 domain-containing protein [Bacillus sp. (in: firmicutes)]
MRKSLYKHNEKVTGFEFDNIGSVKIRYFLKIKLDNAFDKVCTFICKNPSDADATVSDPTINILSELLHTRENCYEIGTIYIVNVYPFYEPNSENLFELLKNINILSPDKHRFMKTKNLGTILRICGESDHVIAAWGENPNGFPKEIYNQDIHKLENELRSNGITTGHLHWKGKELTDTGYYFHPGRKSVSNLMIKW